MRVISLGWGVQSFALAAMSALGVLPRVDAAIHADTTHERSETYDFARRWTPWLEARGVRVVTVKGYDHYLKPYDVYPTPESYPQVLIAAHTTYPNGKISGFMRRQCTGHWKIRPIRRWLQANRKKPAEHPIAMKLSEVVGDDLEITSFKLEKVEQWLGITLDEVQRMKQADVKYVVNAYPFIEYLDRPWTRGMVMRWLQDNDLEIPVKSSCVFCPFHDRATWREIKMSGNGDWQKALEVDEVIRDKRPGYKCYLVAQRVPLADIDFRNEEDHGQLSLWGEECSGMCFL